mmetsp:Transcript_25490/g.62858  ORF Transcript_25490/g.62858 Transcript_25490/m.62858 type:complete len:402 (+) Transcript_25490:710-1915(+)
MFAEAHTHLTSGVERRNTLKTTWSLSVGLQELSHRLEEVDRLARVPDKIRAFILNSHYVPAVEPATESCSTLTKPAYAVLGVAIHDLRRECIACKEMVKSRMHAELVKLIFCRNLKCRRMSEAIWSFRARSHVCGKRRGGGFGLSKREQATNDDVDARGGGDDYGASNSSDEDHVNFIIEGNKYESEFLLETMLGFVEGIHATAVDQISYLVACLEKLGDISRTYASIEQIIPTEVGKMVRVELVHCRARRCNPLSLKVMLSESTTDTASGRANNEESNHAMELIFEHLFCIFCLVFSDLRHMENPLKIHEIDCCAVYGYHSSLLSCAVEAIDATFVCANEGVLLRGDGRMEVESLGKVGRQQDGWWRWAEVTRGGERQHEDDSTELYELQTFMWGGRRTV